VFRWSAVYAIGQGLNPRPLLVNLSLIFRAFRTALATVWRLAFRAGIRPFWSADKLPASASIPNFV